MLLPQPTIHLTPNDLILNIGVLDSIFHTFLMNDAFVITFHSAFGAVIILSFFSVNSGG